MRPSFSQALLLCGDSRMRLPVPNLRTRRWLMGGRRAHRSLMMMLSLVGGLVLASCTTPSAERPQSTPSASGLPVSRTVGVAGVLILVNSLKHPDPVPYHPIDGAVVVMMDGRSLIRVPSRGEKGFEVELHAGSYRIKPDVPGDTCITWNLTIQENFTASSGPFEALECAPDAGGV